MLFRGRVDGPGRVVLRGVLPAKKLLKKFHFTSVSLDPMRLFPATVKRLQIEADAAKLVDENEHARIGATVLTLFQMISYDTAEDESRCRIGLKSVKVAVKQEAVQIHSAILRLGTLKTNGPLVLAHAGGNAKCS